MIARSVCITHQHALPLIPASRGDERPGDAAMAPPSVRLRMLITRDQAGAVLGRRGSNIKWAGAERRFDAPRMPCACVPALRACSGCLRCCAKCVAWLTLLQPTLPSAAINSVALVAAACTGPSRNSRLPHCHPPKTRATRAATGAVLDIIARRGDPAGEGPPPGARDGDEVLQITGSMQVGGGGSGAVWLSGAV
jgi:hypothetical protein